MRTVRKAQPDSANAGAAGAPSSPRRERAGLYLKITDENRSALDGAMELIRSSHGGSAVFLYYDSEKKLMASKNLRCTITDGLTDALKLSLIHISPWRILHHARWRPGRYRGVSGDRGGAGLACRPARQEDRAGRRLKRDISRFGLCGHGDIHHKAQQHRRKRHARHRAGGRHAFRAGFRGGGRLACGS